MSTRQPFTAPGNVDLPAPTIDDATSGYLDPRLLIAGTIARVPASVELLPGDAVTMHFGGEIVPGEPPEFYVGALTIGRFLGTTVEVYYTLLRNGVSTGSQRLPLRIGNFTEQDPALPHPAIAEATSDLLDLATFEGPANVTSGTWPLAAQGQIAWLEVHGTASGSARIIVLLDNHIVTGEEATYGLRRPLDRASLEALDDGSPITVKVWVSFGGSPYKPDAVLFPLRSYSLRQAGPRVLDFEDYAIGDYPIGSTFGPVTIITASGLHHDVTNLGGDSPPYMMGHRLRVDSTGMYLQLDKPYQHVKFAVGVGRYGGYSTITIVVYDELGQEITSVQFPSELASSITHWVELNSPTPFMRILVHDTWFAESDPVFIDNLQVW